MLNSATALSDTGLVRPANQDTAHAGARVLAVADGFGTNGAPASTAAVEALKSLDGEPLPGGERPLDLLEDAVRGAARAVQDAAPARTTAPPSPPWCGQDPSSDWSIGDSRAYLLRDGELFRITHDHTMVQSMIDEGRLTPEEAVAHPQRALLLKALTGGADSVVPDPPVARRPARPSLPALLGRLSTVVADEELRRLRLGPGSRRGGTAPCRSRDRRLAAPTT